MPPLADSPVVRNFEWSPLVQGIVKRNLHLYTPPSVNELPANLSGLLAIHLRRGDFLGHCRFLNKYGVNFSGWNLPPHAEMDRFPVINADTMPNAADRLDTYLRRCLPGVSELMHKIQTVKSEWEASPASKGGNLSRVYILTNGEEPYRVELARRLKLEGWEGVAMTLDMDIHKEEKEVDMVADMMIAERAEVFIGNGVSLGFCSFRFVAVETEAGEPFQWSSFTSNINLLRLRNGAPQESIRFL